MTPLRVAGSLQLTSAKSGLTNRTETSRGAEGATCMCGIIIISGEKYFEVDIIPAASYTCHLAIQQMC